MTTKNTADPIKEALKELRAANEKAEKALQGQPEKKEIPTMNGHHTKGQSAKPIIASV